MNASMLTPQVLAFWTFWTLYIYVFITMISLKTITKPHVWFDRSRSSMFFFCFPLTGMIRMMHVLVHFEPPCSGSIHTVRLRAALNGLHTSARAWNVHWITPRIFHLSKSTRAHFRPFPSLRSNVFQANIILLTNVSCGNIAIKWDPKE